mmetsp:Transcript_70040/g.183559  ORF Transcript_70040/g.183559 Transcript_70040/m.183559 type:complete len:253 (-) Transcript_70040:10-768(-)
MAAKTVAKKPAPAGRPPAKKAKKVVKSSAAPTKSAAALARLTKRTKHGQNLPTSDLCMATFRDGRPCAQPRADPAVPYCRRCTKSGDPSLKVQQHPHYGKILIAARDLPKPYYAGWWGTMTPAKKLPLKRWEWALQTTKGMIDAVGHAGSQLKFCACPGPGEMPTIDFAPNDASLLRHASKGKLGCALFRSLRDIPQGHQVTMMYNLDERTTDKFFKELGIPRSDVGTKRFPALRKRHAGPAPWEAPVKEAK